MIRYIWLVVVFAAAYVLSGPVYQFLPTMIDGLTRGILSSSYTRLLQTNEIVATVGHLVAGAVILTFLGFTVLALVEGFLVTIARNRIRAAHQGAASKAPFSKSRLEDAMSHAPFLEGIMAPYVRDLISVHGEKKHFLRRGKDETVRYETLEAMRAAGEIVGPDQLVDQRLFLWLFAPLPGLLWGLGVVAGAFAFASVQTGPETTAWTGVIWTAATVLALSGAGAMIVALLHRPVLAMRRVQARRFADELDQLLRYQPLTVQLRDLQMATATQTRHLESAIKTLTDTVSSTAKSGTEALGVAVAEANRSSVESLKTDMEAALAQPLKSLTESARRLSEDQSAQIQQVLRATLKSFIAEIEKHVGGQIRESQSLVKAVAEQAGKLEKSYIETNKALAKQARTQAAELGTALDKALKSVASLEKSMQSAIKTDLDTVTTELADAAASFKKLSSEALKVTAALEPALGEIRNNQKALTETLEARDGDSKALADLISELKATSNASRASAEGIASLANQMRKLPADNGTKLPSTDAKPRADKSVSGKIGQSLRQLRDHADSTTKDLPKL